MKNKIIAQGNTTMSLLKGITKEALTPIMYAITAIVDAKLRGPVAQPSWPSSVFENWNRKDPVATVINNNRALFEGYAEQTHASYLAFNTPFINAKDLSPVKIAELKADGVLKDNDNVNNHINRYNKVNWKGKLNVSDIADISKFEKAMNLPEGSIAARLAKSGKADIDVMNTLHATWSELMTEIKDNYPSNIQQDQIKYLVGLQISAIANTLTVLLSNEQNGNKMKFDEILLNMHSAWSMENGGNFATSSWAGIDEATRKLDWAILKATIENLGLQTRYADVLLAGNIRFELLAPITEEQLNPIISEMTAVAEQKSQGQLEQEPKWSESVKVGWDRKDPVAEIINANRNTFEGFASGIHGQYLASQKPLIMAKEATPEKLRELVEDGVLKNNDNIKKIAGEFRATGKLKLLFGDIQDVAAFEKAFSLPAGTLNGMNEKSVVINFLHASWTELMTDIPKFYSPADQQKQVANLVELQITAMANTLSVLLHNERNGSKMSLDNVLLLMHSGWSMDNSGPLAISSWSDLSEPLKKLDWAILKGTIETLGLQKRYETLLEQGIERFTTPAEQVQALIADSKIKEAGLSFVSKGDKVGAIYTYLGSTFEGEVSVADALKLGKTISANKSDFENWQSCELFIRSNKFQCTSTTVFNLSRAISLSEFASEKGSVAYLEDMIIDYARKNHPEFFEITNDPNYVPPSMGIRNNPISWAPRG